MPAEVTRQLRQEGPDRQARPDDGLNHVLGQVAVRLIRKYLESLPGQPGILPLHIVGQEKPMAATVFVDLPGEATLCRCASSAGPTASTRCPTAAAGWWTTKPASVERRELNLRGTQKPLLPPKPWSACSRRRAAGPTRCGSSGSTALCWKATKPTRAARLGGGDHVACARLTRACSPPRSTFSLEGTGEPDFLRASAVLVAAWPAASWTPPSPSAKPTTWRNARTVLTAAFVPVRFL
ncbi:MAG: hypothetical protein WKG07_41160 [Hymenobacter sp.]